MDYHAWQKQQEEQNYQRSLARARTGEGLQAQAQGREAAGLNKPAAAATEEAPGADNAGWVGLGFRNTGAIKSQDGAGRPYDQPPGGGGASTETVAPAGESPAAAPAAPEPSVAHPDDEIPRMAYGGRLRAGDRAVVGEDGPEVFRADRSGTVVPNRRTVARALPSGFRNTGAATRLEHPTVTAARISEAGHRAGDVSKEKINTETVAGHKAVEETRGKWHEAAAATTAAPHMVAAKGAETKAQRIVDAEAFALRDAEHNAIVGDMKKDWPQTVATFEKQYRDEHGGKDMDPSDRANLLKEIYRGDAGVVRVHKSIGSPEYGRLVSMGEPKEGEPLRVGQMLAQGYQQKPDGTWSGTKVNPMSGTKYEVVYENTANGLARKEMALARPAKFQGPGLSRDEEGYWYGTRASGAQQRPPTTLTMDQVFNPKFVEGYNKNAERVGSVTVTPAMIKENPGAAAWLILSGVNKLNTSVGDGVNDLRHLSAKTYVLGDDDTKQALAGHQAWMTGKPAPAPAKAAAPAPAPAAVAAAPVPVAGAATEAVAAPTAAAPAVPAPAAVQAAPNLADTEIDPAKRLYNELGRGFTKTGQDVAAVGGEVARNLKNAANYPLAEGGGALVRAYRNLVPGGYQNVDVPTPGNPLGIISTDATGENPAAGPQPLPPQTYPPEAGGRLQTLADRPAPEAAWARAIPARQMLTDSQAEELRLQRLATPEVVKQPSAM